MKTQKTAKQVKEVTVIAVYKFRQIARICFETLSSDNTTHYHTCFDGNAEKSSCTCPGGQSFRGNCYHQDGLRARAALYFESRQPAQPVASDTVAILTPEGVAIIDKSEVTEHDIIAETIKKADAMVEAQQFIARVQAEKAALHNAAEGHFEERVGRLIPMR